jgi:acetyltransferase-like isoleucine patch superfamily enzyme
MTVFELINLAGLAVARARAQIFYRCFLGKLGRKTAIYRPLLVSHPDRMFIGSRVTIRDGARLEVVRVAGLAPPRLVIGDNVNIEQNVHIVCGSEIIIGNDVSITGNVAIVDVNHPYEDISGTVKVGNRVECKDNFVRIGDGVFIGYGATILPNVKIGARAIIGAGAVVTKDVPEYSVVSGNPARVVKKYNFEQNKWETIK